MKDFVDTKKQSQQIVFSILSTSSCLLRSRVGTTFTGIRSSQQNQIKEQKMSLDSSSFAPGDGVEIRETKQRGDVVQVNTEQKTAVIALVTQASASTTFNQQQEQLVTVSWTQISHLLPETNPNSSCGAGFPYCPSAADRLRFGQIVGWQQKWAPAARCGEWCCYSTECGAHTCFSCRRTAIYPRCPQCNAAHVGSQIPDRCPFSACGADLSEIRSGCKRYVCAKQIAVSVGPENHFVLNPTYCSCFCDRCFHSGSLTHPHEDFIEIDQTTGEHRAVKIPGLSLAVVGKNVAAWKQLFNSWKSKQQLNQQQQQQLSAIASEVAEVDLSSEQALRRIYSLFNDDDHLHQRRALLSSCAPRRTVAAGESKEDHILCMGIDEGEEYVFLHTDCDVHVYLPETVPQLLKADMRSHHPDFFTSCPYHKK